MTTATLTKWGNSQGIIIPKGLCDQLDLQVGDKVVLEFEGDSINLRPQRKAFHRSRTVNIDELFAGWDGAYEPPSDWPTIGNEIDWGESVGKEVW